MQLQPRFGEFLSRLASISKHDVEEILHEQGQTRRRFGEIALAWGLCRPEHVWNAWCNQLAQSGQCVDLTRISIDEKAVEFLPPEMARRLKIIPLRIINDHLILAAADLGIDRAMPELSQMLQKKIRFVQADAQQIQDAIAQHYPCAVDAA
jgi:hypothetical protein